jgi:putative phosphoesterase
MRIGLISDTHNDQARIRRALERLEQEGIGLVIHAGDVTGAKALRLFSGFDVWIAKGNMDRDPALAHVSRELFGPGRLRDLHKVTLDGARIAVIHSGETTVWRSLVSSKEYDYVIHGHSHKPRDERIGSTRVINPGALGSTRFRLPTFAILDLETDDLSWIQV